MTSSERVPGRGLRRFAERTFDGETVERVILPALADLQHESAVAGGAGRRRLASLRAYWGVWKTIGLCTLGDVMHNKDGISMSLGARTLVFLPIALAVLMIPTAPWMVSFASTYGTRTAIVAGALLLPANVLVALPAAFFFALAMFRTGDGVPTGRLLSSAIAGSLACAVIVFALLMAVAPTTNQAYRTHVFDAFQGHADNARIPLRKGLTEMTLPELNEHIRHAPSGRQGELARAHRQERFAFVGMVFVLGLLGLGFAGRWRSSVRFAAALVVFVLYSYCFSFGADVNKYGYPAAYGTWTANGAFLVIALRILRSRRKTEAMLNAEC